MRLFAYNARMYDFPNEQCHIHWYLYKNTLYRLLILRKPYLWPNNWLNNLNQWRTNNHYFYERSYKTRSCVCTLGTIIRINNLKRDPFLRLLYFCDSRKNCPINNYGKSKGQGQGRDVVSSDWTNMLGRTMSVFLSMWRVHNYNKTPAQAFTPPAEKKIGTKWHYVQLLREHKKWLFKNIIIHCSCFMPCDWSIACTR